LFSQTDEQRDITLLGNMKWDLSTSY